MRSAIRQMNQVQFGSDAGNAFEPRRGPAHVTRFPLNPMPPLRTESGGAKASVNELKAAMTMAGLSGAR